MKQQKINQFPLCWHAQTNTLHGALKSALCMKHSVTHVAWVLSAASFAGAQMAMDILATAPPRGRCALWWRFTDSVGHLSLHDSLFSTSLPLPWLIETWGGRSEKSGRHVKDGYLCGVHEKVRAGYLLRQQHQWNPGAGTTVKLHIVDKALSDSRRKLSALMPKP